MQRLPRRGIYLVSASVIALAGSLSASAGHNVASAATAKKTVWKHGQVGVVRYILHGLTVTPPKAKSMKGKVKLPLFNQYGVRTGTAQKASIAFHDGTLIHFNQHTDALLASPTVTTLKSGEIQEVLKPGTNHQIQTASALGAATGTIIDVKVVNNKATYVVLEGALRVTTKHGSVLVKTNQKTTVIGSNKPTQVTTVNAAQVTSWSAGIPAPTVAEENFALDANGGRVSDYSSQANGNQSPASAAIDGSVSSGWSSASGQVTNQWIKIGFEQNTAHNIGEVVIDPGPANDSNDIKDFQIRVSTTGTDDADFTTVYSGTVQQKQVLQRFQFPQTVPARYVELYALDNYGGSGSIDVAEFEVVGFGNPITLPVPTISTAACPGDQQACIQALLTMINTTRAQNNLGPLTLSVTQSAGTATCAGSIGHSEAMAATGSTWITQSGYASASFPNDICTHNAAPGENIGFEATGNELTDLQAVQADMMAHPHDSAACSGGGNAACNILAPDFNQVGIGLVELNGGTFVTEDFLQ